MLGTDERGKHGKQRETMAALTRDDRGRLQPGALPAELLQQMVARYVEEDATLEELSGEFGGSVSTVARRLRKEGVEIRPRGMERTAARVQLVCGWCGETFELRESEARAWPGRRFCSQQCQWDWLWHGPDAAARRESALAGLQRQRDELAERNAAAGMLYLDEFVTLLPRRLQRSRPALLRHIARGMLGATAYDERGRRLFSRAALAPYLESLLRHPDPRARRFNEDGQWVDGWNQVHNDGKPGAAAGWFNSTKGKKPGPKSKLAAEAEAEIRQLRASGKSLRQIVIALEGEVTLKQVRRVIAARRN